MSQEAVSLNFRFYLRKRKVIHVDRLPFDVTNDAEVRMRFFQNVVEPMLSHRSSIKSPHVAGVFYSLLNS